MEVRVGSEIGCEIGYNIVFQSINNTTRLCRVSHNPADLRTQHFTNYATCISYSRNMQPRSHIRESIGLHVKFKNQFCKQNNDVGALVAMWFVFYPSHSQSIDLHLSHHAMMLITVPLTNLLIL